MKHLDSSTFTNAHCIPTVESGSGSISVGGATLCPVSYKVVTGWDSSGRSSISARVEGTGLGALSAIGAKEGVFLHLDCGEILEVYLLDIEIAAGRFKSNALATR